MPVRRDSGYMSHFACADNLKVEQTNQQQQRFLNVTSALNNKNKHLSLANSAAIMAHPSTHHDWVRPGIMLYGAAPVNDSRYPLQAVMTLQAPIISIQTIKAGESVGYHQRWTATHNSTIAVIAIGYGDGYPRHASNGTPVKIGKQTAHLVGHVSMDTISVDISHCPSLRIGDSATLWGEELAVNLIAEHANTISYDLLTGITPRVKKHYI